jgi:hypothetical protein
MYKNTLNIWFKKLLNFDMKLGEDVSRFNLRFKVNIKKIPSIKYKFGKTTQTIEISYLFSRAILIVLIILLTLPSYNIFKISLGRNMRPWINDSTYQNLYLVTDYDELDNINNPVFVFYKSKSFGLLHIYRNYTYIILGEHYAYYGKIEDAINLTPPNELSYLSNIEQNKSLSLFMDTNDYNNISLSEFTKDNEDFSLIIMNQFYRDSVPDNYYVKDGLAVINIKVKNNDHLK